MSGLWQIEPEPGTCDPDAFANAWVGAPFKFDGRTRQGVDCWGLAWCFYRDCLGLILPDWTKGNQGEEWIKETIAGEMRSGWHELPAPADCCLVIAAPAGRPAHVGIFWRGGVLHAERPRGVVWEPLSRFKLTYREAHFGTYEGGARI
jgi:cell wall-associated NlpC family hydrolase